MHDFQEQCQTVPCDAVFALIFFKTMYKDSGLVVSRIIKVLVSVVSLGHSARLITVTSTLIIPNCEDLREVVARIEPRGVSCK